VKCSRHLTATDIAECCVCEQRVVLDHRRGKRRTALSRRLMRAGTAAHAELHREALRELHRHAGDARCFVATALWGAADPRTQALREGRDRWLLQQRWGPLATRLYYRMSPRLVTLMARAPWLRAFLDCLLSIAANRAATKYE
jgi:hypothetical protein